MAIKLNSCPLPVSALNRINITTKKKSLQQMVLVCWTLFIICTYSKKAAILEKVFPSSGKEETY